MLRKLTEEQLEELLERAIEEFGSKGLERAAVSDIARHSGISVGVIYKYYANKDALFEACLRRSMSVLQITIEQAVTGEETLLESCEKLVRACIRVAKEHTSYVQMYHAITVHQSRGNARKYATWIEAATARTYTKLIGMAKEEGIVRADMEPGFFAMFFDNLLMMLHFSYACTYYQERMKFYCGKTEDPDEVIVSQMLLFLKNAFGVKEEA